MPIYANRTPQHRSVKPLRDRGHARERGRAAARFGRKPLPQRLVTDEPCKSVRESVHVSHLEEEATDLIFENVTYVTDLRGDRRESTRHRVQESN